MSKIVLATGNQGKVKELASLLAEHQIEIVPQSNFNVPEVAETGTTFVENAIIKARHAAKITGLPAIADDSGLEVDALNGAPGVYSARYASDIVGEQVSDACPLCRSLRRYCLSCPVFQKTGNINNGCIGTPWQKWYTTHHKDVAERQKHAYEEALFLFNLLPEEEIIAEFTIFFLRKELEKKNEKK